MQHLRKNWYNYSVIKSKIDLLDRYIILNEILYRFVCLIKLTLFFALFTNMHVKVHQKFGLTSVTVICLITIAHCCHIDDEQIHWQWENRTSIMNCSDICEQLQNINHEVFRHPWTAQVFRFLNNCKLIHALHFLWIVEVTRI